MGSTGSFLKLTFQTNTTFNPWSKSLQFFDPIWSKLSQVTTSSKQPPWLTFWVVAYGRFDCNLIFTDMDHTVHAAESCKTEYWYL